VQNLLHFWKVIGPCSVSPCYCATPAVFLHAVALLKVAVCNILHLLFITSLCIRFYKIHLSGNTHIYIHTSTLFLYIIHSLACFLNWLILQIVVNHVAPFVFSHFFCVLVSISYFYILGSYNVTTLHLACLISLLIRFIKYILVHGGIDELYSLIMAQAESKQGTETIIKIIRFIYLPNKCIFLESKKQHQFMFNLKWMFANQGLNQDDPAQFDYRAQFENLFTCDNFSDLLHLRCLSITSFITVKLQSEFCLNLNW
jgi:hypothetical protein